MLPPPPFSLILPEAIQAEKGISREKNLLNKFYKYKGHTVYLEPNFLDWY
ncbi:8319_t:CDS:2 [Funneliformis geosporum]|nr:8319_t:CDS:2 [Funneliformis geosporum]